MKHSLILFTALLVFAVGMLAAGCGSGGGTQSVPELQPTPTPTPTPTTPPTLAFNTDTVLQVGETRRIENTQTDITFVSVDEDSRCPIDANCVSAGTFRVKLFTATSGVPSAALFDFSQPPGSIDLPSGTLTLRAISPDKQGAVTINPADYKITVRLSPPISPE